uniref:ABC-type multidrug transport system, ATPase component n=1 Tax=Candidatus Actinomarina minuta TaxID=1389454 RepID=S5DPB2_9ACTN|nr:ABC-type multidrug transport system, ATPase component [Candidatus Actinomarina minuta]
MKAVEANNLHKTFTSKKESVEAVKGVSFSVEQGEVFSILGPNGAGKSTTILMLTTLLGISKGTASIMGLDVEKQDKEVRTKIGVALQDTGIDLLLTARELLYTTGRLWGLNKQESNTRTEELLQLVGLTESADRRVKTYSGGMKRRLDLGLSLVNEPEVLFLDEPTTGLDPASRRVIWDEIKRLNNNGVTVILTTQYLEEADELSDRLLIIDKGVVATEGTSDELKASVGGDVVTFDFEKEENMEVAKRLIDNAKVNQKQLRITVKNGAEHIPIFMKTFTENKLNVKSVSANKPTLDDVFLKVTGFSMENDNQSEKKQSKKSNYEKRRRRIRR